MDHHTSSRREFLVASTLGLLGIARGARALELDEHPPNELLLYVGTYTDDKRSEGIYLVRMNTRTGALRSVGAVSAGANPSFLAIHPNGRFLYAVNETTERNGKPSGGVSSFGIARDGSLTRVNEQASEGGAPCYVSVDRRGRFVLVANYVGGNVALLPIGADGALAAATYVDQHHGTGPNTQRQEAAHAHSILPDPSNRFALAADLGIDRVLVYRLEADGKSLHHVAGGDAHLEPGAGPRHLAFHPRLPLVYVSNELGSSVSALRFDAARGKLTPIETKRTVDAGSSGTNYPADIHVSPAGNTVYVSNRGHNSIAVFSAAGATGRLRLEQLVSTEGDWPRNFTLDPTGRWLLVANQRSGSVVVFARDRTTGRLTKTGSTIALPSPVCLRFHVSS